MSTSIVAALDVDGAHGVAHERNEELAAVLARHLEHLARRERPHARHHADGPVAVADAAAFQLLGPPLVLAQGRHRVARHEQRLAAQRLGRLAGLAALQAQDRPLIRPRAADDLAHRARDRHGRAGGQELGPRPRHVEGAVEAVRPPDPPGFEGVTRRCR